MFPQETKYYDCQIDKNCATSTNCFNGGTRCGSNKEDYQCVSSDQCCCAGH